MKIVIPGGSGRLGILLTAAFRERGDEVVILSRHASKDAIFWDGRTLGDWTTVVDGADVVVNLAGRSVDCRYDARRRAEIMESRIDSTRVIGEAIARAKRPPRVWLQMSTATIYAHRYDAPNDEHSGIIGGSEPDASPEWRFSIDVARAWERTIEGAPTPRTRKVIMRTAMVMHGTRGGPFAAMRRHVRLGFGRFGDGRQYMSWIHERDFVRAVIWLATHDELAGTFNLASPEPLQAGEFLRVLSAEYGGWLGLPTSGWVLELGAFIMRTEPELVLKSRRVIPTRLQESGFTFELPRWNDAAAELCGRFPLARQRRTA